MACNAITMNIYFRCGLLLCLSWVCLLSLTHAQPLDATALQWQRVELGKAGERYPFAMYSNKPWSGDMTRVRKAVLVFHGLGRNGAGYFTSAQKMLNASGAEEETLLLAPNYFIATDAAHHAVSGLPLWRGSRWNRGEDAANWPRPLSSFQPIDDVLAVLADRTKFTSLEIVVLAGHSGGGQLMHRYSVLNSIEGILRGVGVRVRYIIANPSSFLYFTNERPLANGAGFAPYDSSRCPAFNDYRYGLDNLPPYASNVSVPELFRRYTERDVTVLLGGADNDPNHNQLDRTCGAQAGGGNRLDRGKNYIRYEAHLANSAMPLKRQAFEVIGVGHSQSRMFGSKCAARLLFGLAEETNAAGAACGALQL